MGAITKVFRNGNSGAVRLPKELGISIGTSVTLDKIPGGVMIRQVADETEEKQKLRALVDILLSLPSPGEIEERVPIEFPDRPGLY